jgi:hypothetical protein
VSASTPTINPAGDLARRLTEQLTTALNLAQAVDNYHDHDDHYHESAVTSALDCARTIDCALAQAVDLDVDVDLTFAFAKTLDRTHTLVMHLDSALAADADGDLDSTVTEVVSALEALSRVAPAPTKAHGETQVKTVRLAGRLVQFATRALPPQHRARYRDEYRSELFELAAAGTSGRGQLIYALRLLDRAWVLRAELRESVARKARS